MAFLSDIHGNLPALEAVLAELARRAVVDIFVLGDLLLGGNQPLEVWQRLQKINARCLRGPSDVALASVEMARLAPANEEERLRAQAFAATRDSIGDLVRQQLAGLEERLRLPLIDGREVLLVHGSPADPYEGIGHELEEHEVEALLADDPADIVVCGATHVPFVREVGDVQVVNVGSVGEAPEGRYAHYTVLSPKVSGADIVQDWAQY